MKKLTKETLDPAIFKLYDLYAHNKLSRRDFVDRLSLYAVGGITLPSLLSFVMPNYQDHIEIKSNDPRINSTYIEYPSPKGGGTIKGLLSVPKNVEKKLGSIVIVHENRGLNPYIEDVARRAALAGYITLAPDALSPLGGYPGNDDEGREMQRKRDRNEMLEDFIAAFHYLKQHENCSGKVGVVGFCFGGWISNMMAVKVPDLSAAVPFYGGQPSQEEVSKINAPLLLHYGALDERVNAGWPEYEKELTKQNKEFQAYFYENARHGFHNNTTPRYDEKMAKLAWSRTMEFFDEKLKS
jgi:carboxymethylenebutenolidase